MSRHRANILQAVVFTDTFDDEFYPLTQKIPSTLMPILGKPILEYTMEALWDAGVCEVFLFCKSGTDAIQEFLRKAKESMVMWALIQIKVIKSECCQTLGDCFRELDGRGSIRGDFILIEPGTITNINLCPIVKKHREIKRKDKDACLTMVCMKTSMTHNMKSEADDCLYIADKSGKLIHFQAYFEDEDIKKKLPEELRNFKLSDAYRNQQDTHISICSEKFITLFSDNFDFETKKEFIQNLLVHGTEVITDCSMYIIPVEDGDFGCAVTNWQTYQAISFDLYDTRSKFRNGFQELNKENGEQRSLVSEKHSIPSSAKVSRCLLGENVKIGENVSLEDSIIFSNSVIGDNVKVNLSVIGPNCVLRKNCEILDNSVLGENVEIKENTKVDKLLVQSTKPEFCEEKDILGEKAYVADLERCAIPEMRTMDGLREKIVKDSVYTFSSEDEDNSEKAPELDDTELFHNEVVESLTRGIEDDVKCENLIFEINGSRYAYHIPLEEVNFFVVKSILKMYSDKPELKYLAKLLTKFKLILKNYIKNAASMKDCLAAIEDQAVSRKEEDKDWILYILKWCYQNEVLSEEAILEWGKSLHPEEKLYIKIHPFLTWLEQAEEESSEDED